MATIINDEPKPIYKTTPPTGGSGVLLSNPPRVPDVRPSPHIEPVVNQLKSAIVEAYKMDGRRVKVVVVEKS